MGVLGLRTPGGRLGTDILGQDHDRSRARGGSRKESSLVTKAYHALSHIKLKTVLVATEPAAHLW